MRLKFKRAYKLLRSVERRYPQFIWTLGITGPDWVITCAKREDVDGRDVGFFFNNLSTFKVNGDDCITQRLTTTEELDNFLRGDEDVPTTLPT